MKSNDWRHKNVARYTPGNTKILYFFNCLLDGMHTKLYPTLGLNRNGKLDFNLDYEDHSKLSYVEYSLILKKAGRL